jgi:tetratricopeptide (TPR) repeat protein
LAGESAAALNDYNAILALEPKHTDALFYRGKEYERVGRIEEAIADFSTVLEMDPSHVKAMYARGACRNIKGDFEGANGKGCLDT